MQNRVKAGVVVPCLLLCMATTNLSAQESPGHTSVLANGSLHLISEQTDPAAAENDSFTVLLDSDAGLDFDLGGSETRKLQLQLNQPLSLTTGMQARVLDNGSNLLGLDATLDVPVSDRLSMVAGANRQLGEARFQSLGSIRCMNGVLRADSYTASGCRFVNEPLATSERQRLDLGARLDFSNASASVSWFNREDELNSSAINSVGPSVMTDSLLSPNLGNPLMSAPGTDPMQYLNSEATGVDLNFKVGFTTDQRGDIRLGLAFSRVLEAEYQGLYGFDSEALSWTLAEPFNTARMNLEFSKGAFSTGIQGYYRDQVDFLNRNSLDSLTTFDVHFTWRTPWNANLSVGASNVLNAGPDAATKTDSQPVDPLESIYGRIPYVRYKQDL